jgi:hypothetical protein
MKRRYQLACVLSVLCMPHMGAQHDNPFLVQPKKKLLSKSKLTEHNTQILGDMLQGLPGLIKAVAELQEVAMERLVAYVEGNKTCFWACATQQELDACLAKLQKFEQHTQLMQKQVLEMAQFLQLLEKK